MRPAGRRRHIPPAILAVMLDYRHSQRREVALPGFPAPSGSLLAMRGWGGGCRRGIRVPCQRLGWDRREARWLERGRQGRGNEFPLPASRHPPWRYPHGPVPGDRWERAGYGFPPAHPRHGCSPDIRPGTDPAPPGRGRSAAGAGGVGLPAEGYGYPPAKAQAAWGCRRGIWVSLMKARVGWGCRQKCTGISC